MAGAGPISKPERWLMRALGSARGWKLDAKILARTGHSPYSYLYGKSLGGSRRTYRPPMALTTIGRRSGARRTVALAYFAIDGGWAVVGSAHGSPREPDWVANARVNADAWVRLARRTTPVTATVLDGDAKAEIWQTITARAPLFDEFQRAAGRDIPIVVLRPRTDVEGDART